ncbi:hypothetical protein QJS04_geneDACA001138 [Acorus gramineus]|uniref:Uncharacterized protein n=1 Tax=Acorus gramineus TaxID=55184 RepID=A0AAV9AEE0_ACOGR|nr:hypothetical protein QJS04_geneDACA001138 [Acorus gramineus]
MWALRRGALMAFSMLVALSLYSAAAAASDRAVVSVVGMGECADCVKKNADAFRGLRVAVKCKNNKEEYKTTAVAVLTENGKFSVDLPTSELIDTEGGGLKTECFAELRSASNKPCPSSNGLESSKIVLKSKEKHQHVYGTMGKLVFSKDTCAAAFLWKCPPYPWHKPFPKLTLPPLHHYSPMHKPPIPEYKPPTPEYKPPTPEYKPPTPEYKPPTPEYKPPTPEYKPPTPEYKPPTPEYKPPTPEYKPPTPEYKPPTPEYKPPTPEYKPPTPEYKPQYKPPVPMYKPPFIYKKPPCPPLSHFKKPFPHFPPLAKKPYPYKYPPHYGFPPKPTHPKASGSKEMAPTKV